MRDPTTKIGLARRSPQNLIVRRESLDLAQRRDPELGAGAAKLFTGNSLFYDTATFR